MENEKLTAFIIDDDNFYSSLIVNWLFKKYLTNVSKFETAEQCLEKIAEKPDIIFLDYNLFQEDKQNINGNVALKAFLSENPKLKIAWIEDELTIYPCAFLQRSVDLDRVLFTEANNDAIWATLQALRSGLFQVVIMSAPWKDEKIIRRLQLTTEKSGSSLIILSDQLRKSWPISLQLQITPSGVRVL